MNYATESLRGMTMPSRGNHKGARRWAAPALVVTLFLLSGFGAAVGNPLAPTAAAHLPGATHPGVSLPATGAATSSVSHSASSAGPKAGGGSNVTYIESGNGTFFNNSAVQNVTTGHGACGKYLSYTESCWNATLDPTVNVTTTGTTGMAYTVWTNETGCPAMQNATTEIGFVSSSDFGATWGTPIILGNPVCTVDSHNDSHYEDAEMPALTSLSNGTFVLSYVESNVSAANYFYYDSEYPMSVGCHYTDYDRVVVSESYNNGVTWTIPTVIQQTDISYTTTYDCANPGTGSGSTLVGGDGEHRLPRLHRVPLVFPRVLQLHRDLRIVPSPGRLDQRRRYVDERLDAPLLVAGLAHRGVPGPDGHPVGRAVHLVRLGAVVDARLHPVLSGRLQQHRHGRLVRR